jgi:hypothetical protein
MQIDEIIARVDRLEPNQYDKETKLSWLSQLDGKIFAEVILTHENPSQRLLDHCNANEETGEFIYKPYTDGNEEPIAGAPYGEDMYVYYIMAMIAYHNMESSKYNQAMTAYNNAYTEFSNWYNRTRKPKALPGGNRFRF